VSPDPPADRSAHAPPPGGPPVPEFRCDVSRLDGTATVRVEGEIDLATTAPLDQALSEARRTGAQRIRIDLAEVTFVDSSAVHLLLRWTQAAEREQWTLSIVQGPAPVRRLFDLTGLLDELPFEADGTA
jgi:anti-sigma B factor antagonist